MPENNSPIPLPVVPPKQPNRRNRKQRAKSDNSRKPIKAVDEKAERQKEAIQEFSDWIKDFQERLGVTLSLVYPPSVLEHFQQWRFMPIDNPQIVIQVTGEPKPLAEPEQEPVENTPDVPDNE